MTKTEQATETRTAWRARKAFELRQRYRAGAEPRSGEPRVAMLQEEEALVTGYWWGREEQEKTNQVGREEQRELVAELRVALAWALPYAAEHAERTSQCCGAPEHSQVEGICAKCRDHTGFENLDLEHCRALLARTEAQR